MTIEEAIKNRHSVRSYKDIPIPENIISQLQNEINKCNMESGLNIQFAVNEPSAFSGLMAHYGKFSDVKNYIALIGKKASDLDEKIGYYGERLVLKAQQLGLNSCWVAMTYSKSKSKCTINKGEKLVCVLALGYGETQGSAHKSKSINTLYKSSRSVPEWFKNGMEAVSLAPTAMNQQKFIFTLDNDTVNAQSTGGFYSKVDLGIVKYHFEAVAGKENFRWA
ncbi:MAG: nitroreductase family protein [Hominilimicola sp.]